MDQHDDLDQQINQLRTKLETLQAESDRRMLALLHQWGIYTASALRTSLGGTDHPVTAPPMAATVPATKQPVVETPAPVSTPAPETIAESAPEPPRPAPDDLSFNALLLQVPLMAKTIRQIVELVEKRTTHRFPRDLQNTLFFTKKFDLPLFTYIKNNVLSDYDPGQAVTISSEQLQGALTYAKHAGDKPEDDKRQEKTAIAQKLGTAPEKPTASLPFKRVTVPAKPKPAGNPRALVERKLIGATAGSKYISESLLRQLGLHGGETVEIVPREQGSSDSLPYFKVIKEAAADYNPHIHRLSFIPTEQDADGQLILKQDYAHKPLTDPSTGETFQYLIDSTRYPLLHVGQLVDFAWYEGQDPTAGKISWIHPLAESAAPEKAESAATPVKKEAKKEAAAPNPEPEEPSLQFDLSGGTVLIVGAPKHDGNVIDMLKKHNGKLEHFDAKSNSYSQLPTMIRHADYVILIPTAASHHSTQTAVSLAKRYDRPFAVANTLSIVNVERAVYRAINGLPARSVSQQDTYLEFEESAVAESN
jgi:hypothetical protein